MFARYGVEKPEFLKTLVTDGDSNYVVAGADCYFLQSFRCLAHCLNNVFEKVVKDPLWPESIKYGVGFCKDLVRAFKQSGSMMSLLNNSLKQKRDPRWNLHFLMLNSILTQKARKPQILEEKQLTSLLETYGFTNWTVLEGVHSLLKQSSRYSEYLSSYPTYPFLPLLFKLIRDDFLLPVQCERSEIVKHLLQNVCYLMKNMLWNLFLSRTGL